MTFVLVDYKGGSAFSDCAHLPHVTGMVTDLDAHLTQRALASLSAELTRRERVLAAAGAKDIEEYTERAGREPFRPPLPRLVIVIDEFASLVRDLPDFVTGLVGIAQRGRSLGIHLILATQRPSGVVSADIRANTSLRIALWVTDAAESADVIDASDAAQISRTTPGRGYARLGHASLVPFQAGRIGGRRPGVTATARPWLRATGWAGLGRPEPRRPEDPEYPQDPEDPAGRQAEDEAQSAGSGDLRVLVAEIRRAAAGLGIPAQPSPWLAPLPPALLLRDLPAPSRPEGLAGQPEAGHAPIPFGLIDLPRLQRQQPAAIDLDTFGHLMGWIYRYVLASPDQAAVVLARWTISSPRRPGPGVPGAYLVSVYHPDRMTPAGRRLRVQGDGTAARVEAGDQGMAVYDVTGLRAVMLGLIMGPSR
jgi:S-DNA-T family DNA segregation ATPase FtsK/SpoIIIE